MLFMLNKMQRETSDDNQDDCLFTVSIQNSHGNKRMGTFLFYRENCLISFNDANLELVYPATRLPKGSNEVGPYQFRFCNRDPIASILATVKTTSKGIFHRRRYGEFIIQACTEFDKSTYKVVERWEDGLGHTWTMLNNDGEPMVAVRTFETDPDAASATYHIYFTERLNLKYCLALAGCVMMLDAGMFPFGPKYIAPTSHSKLVAPTVETLFISKAEQDEWGLYGATEGGSVSLPDS